MALTGAPYRFDNEAPTVTEIHAQAERSGGLPIKVVSQAGGADEFEFGFLRGRVRVHRSSNGILITSDTGAAPVLFDLLRVVLEERGGRVQGSEQRVELELPLTERSVVQTTDAYRRELERLARRAAMMLAGLVVLGLGMAGLIVWLAVRWLTGLSGG